MGEESEAIQEVQQEVINEEQGAAVSVDAPEAVVEPSALEAEASEAGWKEGGRLSAEEYLAHKEVLSSKERNKRLIQENQELKAKQDAQEARLARQEEAAEAFRKFQSESHERELARLKVDAEQQIAALKQQKAEAIRNGDGEAVLDIDDRIDAVKERSRVAAEVKPEPAPVKPEPVVEVAPAQAPNHPDFDAWVAENEWFKKDTELNETAEAMAIILKRNGETSTGKVFFDKVKERVRKLHPDKFGNPNRSKPGVVETSSTQSSSYRGKTVDDLDSGGKAVLQDALDSGAYKKEAKAAGMSVEAYFLKQYFK